MLLFLASGAADGFRCWLHSLSSRRWHSGSLPPRAHVLALLLCLLRPPCSPSRSSELARDLPPPPVDVGQPAGEGRRRRSRSPMPLRGMARGPPPPEERWQLCGDDDAPARWELEVEEDG